MQAWIEFYIVLGKIFFVILVAILVAIILCLLGKWLDRSNEDTKKNNKPIDGTNWLSFGGYDSSGQIKPLGDELRGLNKNYENRRSKKQ